MSFYFNLWFRIITIVIFSLMLFYAPVFALTLLGVILVLGVIGGILLWKYRHR